MSWKLTARPVTQKITRQLVKEFVEMDPAPHDRPLSERRLAVYRKMFAEGMFRPCTWARASCLETNTMYRVNGKHTSLVLNEMAKLPDFYVTIETYQCDSMDDVARLYSTFDSGIQSRTANDIYLSFAATVPELAGISAEVITKAAAGISFNLWGVTFNTAYQPAERAENLLIYPEFVTWLQNIFTGTLSGESSKRHIRRVACVAAMHGSWLKNRQEATKFWEMVRDGTGASPGTPDRKLEKFLLTTGVDTGNGSRTRTRKAQPREIYVRCIHAWNAWRKNESTNLNYFPDAEIPSFR